MRLGGIVLTSLLAVVSCQNEEVVNNASQEGQQITIEAVRGLNSRTSLIPGTEENTYQTVWSAEDKIYVTSADGKTTGVLTIDPNDAGSPEGTFTGFVFGNPDDLKYSIFPVPENGVINLNNVDTDEIDAPMTAEIDPVANKATFSNSCALVRLFITGLSRDNNTVVVSGTDIAGKLEPSITSSGIALNQLEKANDITITGVQNAEYFFVPVYATDTQTSVTLSVKVNNSNAKNVTANILKGKVAQTNLLAVRNGQLIDPSTDLNGGTEGGEGEGDNTAAYVASGESLATAITNGATDLYLAEGEYTLPSGVEGKTLTISGTKETIVDATKGAYMDKSTLSFEGVTIKIGLGYAHNGGGDYAAIYTPNATFTNCNFEGGLRVGRNGAKFEKCIFNLDASDYVYTYGNDVDFINCIFNSKGKALIMYSDGNGDISKVNVTGCEFYASQEGFAGAIKNQSCAAIEIDNYGCGVELTLSGNTVGKNFSGQWRIKTYYTDKGNKVSINGQEYTSIAIDGKYMTIDSDKNVTMK